MSGVILQLPLYAYAYGQIYLLYTDHYLRRRLQQQQHISTYSVITGIQ